MKQKHLGKIKKNVSTAMLLTVLTLILTACHQLDKTDTNVNVVASEGLEYAEKIADGEYELYVSLLGGTGKATVKSPTKAIVRDNKVTVTIEWSSPNYDYMVVDGNKYLPINTSGNSAFEIPISEFECNVNVIADTVAMSKPHEIEYELVFSQNDLANKSENIDVEQVDNNTTQIPNEINEWISNHSLTGKLERKYAEKFAVTYYDDKYCIATINGTDFYLISKSDKDIPNDLPDSIVVIKAPVEKAYVVSSASYNYFSTLDSLSCINFTSLKKDEIDDDELNEKLKDGTIKYAGKYSAPDYELLLSGGVGLVVENTMILHSVDVLNQLKQLKINTLIDYSSQESTPLGRMEWIKLYGVLTGNEEKANTLFSEKEEDLLKGYENTGKKVAYFYITNAGAVVVRRNQDYIAKLIEMSGGEYVFSGLTDYDGTGTMSIQKEAFFEAVSDCDYLIYNSTISGPMSNLDELSSKCEVLINTKAYREGNVFCTTENIYVKAMELPDIAKDINKILNNKEDLEYLYKLK